MNRICNSESFLFFLSFYLSTLIGMPLFAKNPKTPYYPPKSIKNYVRPDVSILGPINLADGLGRQTSDLVLALHKDLKIQIIPGSCFKPQHLPVEIKGMITAKTPPLGRVILIQGLWLKGLSNIETLPHKNDIFAVYSMLESTRIPSSWVTRLNLYYDAVIVPDPFLIEAYEQSGVTIPVFCIPLGLQFSNFLTAPLKEKRGYPFVFANLSSTFPRKNQIKLIRAFAQAFGNNPDVVLKINARTGVGYSSAEEIRREIHKLGCSNIFFSEKTLDQQEYLKFFQEIDCYVSLSTGEGFSIQPREAMALGIPVIATDNTGQSTICNSGLVKVVKSEIRIPAEYGFSKVPIGEQFDCKLEDAMDAMIEVFSLYDSYLDKREQAREWAAQYAYSNPDLQTLYKSFLSPKKILLGDKNSVTGELLTTNSSKLYNKYKRIILKTSSDVEQ